VPVDGSKVITSVGVGVTAEVVSASKGVIASESTVCTVRLMSDADDADSAAG
jgi:hypothetical protein